MVYLLVGLPGTLVTFVILARQYRSPHHREEVRAFYSDRIALRYGFAAAAVIEALSVVDLGFVGILTGVLPALLLGSVVVVVVEKFHRRRSGSQI